ncbi:MAG: imidazole glycerol phosphate synthase subunit HisH [Aquamicrobium sp.]|jgi:glutamine amidotransferase|uniref:imidazole glycerol phosphate synthase subunit HisH n=1 Tax=Mesorhizobium sp. Pch-S TaxID=2082387 RepID=UPI0010112896|nr:imidazole glycerol phosphate synthase subunit HisH [Mesorhizobium sp. Pch-S]MBR2687868.1 imidazole glycerol phosphate synthase subunit HisH [Aquamicrobium sp.]QAZ41788.1 imidazole glycerol phosphate synthase subunit HisH [Mesorhizobium sp. Pch-S]
MIAIVDYGLGNIGSVAHMLRHIGADCTFASTVEEIEKADALILPGVGAFDYAMDVLHRKGFVQPLRRQALDRKIPILGICLGMQLLASRSEEGNATGLELIDAEFLKFRPEPGTTLKVPHMGWNAVTAVRDNPLIASTEEEQRFYFVHSYYARTKYPSDDIATCNYGVQFVAAYGRDNVFGVQFHPERSHKFGMSVLKSFATLAC